MAQHVFAHNRIKYYQHFINHASLFCFSFRWPHAIKVLEKCTKNLIGHSRLAFNNHESNIDC